MPLHRQVVKIILPQISIASVRQTHEQALPGIQYRKLVVTATVQPIIQHLGCAEEFPCTTIIKLVSCISPLLIVYLVHKLNSVSTMLHVY